jgi:hypothetical protein
VFLFLLKDFPGWSRTASRRLQSHLAGVAGFTASRGLGIAGMETMALQHPPSTLQAKVTTRQANSDSRLVASNPKRGGLMIR